jgi:hypothetical protein
MTRLGGASAARAVGLMVSTEGEEFVRRGIWSTHGRHRLGIGGGGAGFEGTLSGSWAGGVRIPVGEHHGPVLRAGLLGYVRGNDDFYASLLELPQLELGYQYQHARTVVELGVTTGAALVGRNRTGETAQRIVGAGFEVGAYGALQLPHFRLGLSAAQLPVDDGLSTPIRVGEGTLCGLLAPFAICADARVTVTDAVVSPGGAASEVRAVYAGLTVGFTREK